MYDGVTADENFDIVDGYVSVLFGANQVEESSVVRLRMSGSRDGGVLSYARRPDFHLRSSSDRGP